MTSCISLLLPSDATVSYTSALAARTVRMSSRKSWRHVGLPRIHAGVFRVRHTALGGSITRLLRSVILVANLHPINRLAPTINSIRSINANVMRSTFVNFLLLSSSIAAAAVHSSPILPQGSLAAASIDNTIARPQAPLLVHPNIVMPSPEGSDKSKDPDAAVPTGKVVISDVLSRERNINIFASLTRDVDSVTARFGDSGINTTVLAPMNSAMTKLPRKPWEDPADYAELGKQAYTGQSGEDRAARNLRRFVEAHIVPENPWLEGQKVKTLDGGMVWWEKKDGVMVVSTLLVVRPTYY